MKLRQTMVWLLGAGVAIAGLGAAACVEEPEVETEPAEYVDWGWSSEEAERQWLVGDIDGAAGAELLWTYRGRAALPYCTRSGGNPVWFCASLGASISDSHDTDQRFLLGDTSGDRKQEVLEVFRGWQKIPVCELTAGRWTCTDRPATIHDSGSWEQRFLTGDFDGDTRTDVFQTYRGWGSIPVCRSTGTGWACDNLPATIHNAGSSEQEFLAGDFDGDRKTDVFQTFRGWGSIPVCRSTGAGWSCANLGATIHDSGSPRQRFVTAEYNKDGRTDIYQLYAGWGSIPVCMSTGSGWSCYNLAATLHDSGSEEQQFLTGDFNGDGKTDVAQTYRGWTTIPVCYASLGWDCRNLPAQVENSGSAYQRFVVVDVDRDGKDDIVQTAPGWNHHRVCYSTGTGWSCSVPRSNLPQWGEGRFFTIPAASGSRRTCSDAVKSQYACALDGSSCTLLGTGPCYPYGCDRAGTGCATRCTSNADCASGAQCDVEYGACVTTFYSCKDTFTVVAANGEETSCAPYECRADRCRQECVDNNDCAPGTQCYGMTCR